MKDIHVVGLLQRYKPKRVKGVDDASGGELRVLTAADLLGGEANSAGPVGSAMIQYDWGRGSFLRFRDGSVRAVEIQVLISLIDTAPEGGGIPVSRLIDRNADLLVSTDNTALIENMSNTWSIMREAQRPVPSVVMTTPKLYGNKTRMSPLILGVLSTILPEGAPVLDLMSGTGIVARTLSKRYRLTVNDANPYAALLSCIQSVDVGPEFGAIAQRILGVVEQKLSELSSAYSDTLSQERVHLYGDLDQENFEAYKKFCERPVSPTGEAIPYSFCTRNYGNAYFGVYQAMQLDALRFAVDECAFDGTRRDVLLGAILIAAAICNSGPHFAQPPRLLTLSSFKKIAERRSRNVVWEFEQSLEGLSNRPILEHHFDRCLSGDWRDALDIFGTANETGAVYIDPPYSKLQYSRYYHVLNVLLAYNNPTLTGTGRYPPSAERFSSKFEYQPTSARHEFTALLRAVAERELMAVVSYSDSGFVAIDEIITLMKTFFSSVTVFEEPLRHHSQGSPTGQSKGMVLEYVLVGK